MTLTVGVQLNGVFAAYKVDCPAEGVYQATLTNPDYHLLSNYPEKITLSRATKGWQSDHHVKQIGLLIGNKIDEQEKSN